MEGQGRPCLEHVVEGNALGQEALHYDNAGAIIEEQLPRSSSFIQRFLSVSGQLIRGENPFDRNEVIAREIIAQRV